MAQQDFDNFKQRLKDWMGTHPEEYATFEAEMNRMDGMGYRKIMALATSMAPGYDEAIDKKIDNGSFNDIKDLTALLSGNDIGKNLLQRLDSADTNPMLPAMLCWLYFGRSFENMLELGEELMAGAGISRHQQFNIANTSKNIVEGSVTLDLRTKEDWTDYSKIKHAIDSNRIVDWALDSPEHEEQPTARPLKVSNKAVSLENMILLTDEKKKILLGKIEEYIHTGVKGKRVAFMVLALRQLGYLPDTTADRQLFTAIKTRFGSYIGSDKSIYAYLDHGVAKQYQKEIDDLATYFNVD